MKVTPDTRLWKGTVTPLAAVEMGDFLYGVGTLLEDGTIAAERLWFNIVNFYAEIISITEKATNKTRLHMMPAGRRSDSPSLEIQIDSDTLINEGQPGSSFEPKEGGSFQVIGLALRDGSIKATRIWVSN